jgi:tripartite-type tricarboxylate transporter receptor subunit TctC
MGHRRYDEFQVRASILILAFAASGALAQGFPTRAIHIVIGFPPGGGIDTVARLIGPKMSESMGQPVVIDNRPGGAGVLGTDVVAKSPPDGHSVFFGTMGNLAVNPVFLPNLPFNMERDLAPVTQAVSTAFMLYVNPSVPANTVKEFIDYAKRESGKLNFCSSGNGGAPHLAAELFNAIAAIQTVHVPYKGSAPCISDLIGGQVQFTFEAVTIGLPHVKSGKLRALGATAAKRLPMLPELPTLAETLPGFDVDNWYGMVVPAATPRAAIERLRNEVVKAMSIPEIRERLLALGQVPVGSAPQEFAAFMKSEGAKWLKVIKQANIQPG